MIFSSRVPRVISRNTETDRFWPSRCARSMACRSFIGFQSWSRNTTVSADVRLRPSPPTLVVSNMRSMLGSELKLSTIAPRRAAGTRPSSFRYDTEGKCAFRRSSSTRSSIDEDCAKTSARWEASVAVPTTTASPPPWLAPLSASGASTPKSAVPIPHSSRICLRAVSLGATERELSDVPEEAANRSASCRSG
eukprot:scaffold94822_cov25-Tisochrysis_lutea.AAC.7